MSAARGTHCLLSEQGTCQDCKSKSASEGQHRVKGVSGQFNKASHEGHVAECRARPRAAALR
jgi:hypothetical protein